MKVYIRQLFDITYIIHKASIMREKQENDKKTQTIDCFDAKWRKAVNHTLKEYLESAETKYIYPSGISG